MLGHNVEAFTVCNIYVIFFRSNITSVDPRETQIMISRIVSIYRSFLLHPFSVIVLNSKTLVKILLFCELIIGCSLIFQGVIPQVVL